MHVLKTISEVRQLLLQIRSSGQSIGFVPTMGALHQGHLSLLQQAQMANDWTICSIYVNPTQFDNASDLFKYPRVAEEDLALLEKHGCQAVFLPTDQEMYPNGMDDISVRIQFGDLETVMEGKYRTGHFNGVGLVVSKLFHIVQPDHAYFGQKDLQQFAIINKMVEDLSFGIKLRRCPIIREKDGLAMSSRNRRLSERERYIASRLYESLRIAQRMLIDGKSIQEIQHEAIANISKHKDFKVEYFEVVQLRDLQGILKADGQEDLAICVAAYLGQVRLIDNIVIEKELLSDLV